MAVGLAAIQKGQSVPGYAAISKVTAQQRLQSVWVHYAALQLAFERKRPLADIPPVMQKLAGGSFPPLPTIPERFAVTHADVIARPIDNHAALVSDWAHCAYEAWSDLNQPTKELLNRIGF
ncbi:hypothetical protein BSZ14_10735 [Sphingomonas sp. Sph1(2015)]|jgi:hypothetical protein|nr:hypothetical protein BSZ14_10735 [Sphingomonas sp. Sph1(2015)]